MIIRAMGLGFVLWLIAMVVFRFLGQDFFDPSGPPFLIMAGVAVAIGAVVTFLCLRLLREAHGDEAEAAIGIALPGMLLDAFVVYEFDLALPNLSPSMAMPFGALMLLTYGTVLFVGLSMSALAPQDERL